MTNHIHESNRLAWNAATEAHNSHKAGQAAFFAAGGSTLFPEDIELLGDLAGKRLLHLQCNAGQDTLSLVRLGATATGVDISDTAIEFARRLSEESGIAAAFERADVYDWLAQAAADGRTFDAVYSSYGALVWLSDLKAWARGIASVLAPNGRLVVVEFHPYAMMYDEQGKPSLSYFAEGQATYYAEGVGDYVAFSPELAPSGYLPGVQDFHNPHPGYEFQWTIADTLTAVIDAGLILTAFREYPYANGFRPFPGMRETPGGRIYPPEEMPGLPMMFGMVAAKP